MITIKQVAQAMQTVLLSSADQAAQASGFIKRKVKLSGATFAQTLVFGWLAEPQATLEELSQTAAIVGVEITPQGLDQRFTAEAADCLQQILTASVAQVLQADPVTIPILQRFEAVYIQDSSTISLPDELAEVWQGCGNKNGQGQAALKLHTRLDLLSGRLTGPLLGHGRESDRNSDLQRAPLPRHALRIADLGYWSLDQFQTFSQAEVYWLSRLQIQTAIFTTDGQRWTLADLLRDQSSDEVDLTVELGVTHRLPARLLARRVPVAVAEERRRKLKAEARRRGETVSQARLAVADWTVLVTNVPVDLLGLSEALVVIRVRWQIELLFKLWKQKALIDESRSQKPWRILCELYAKLVGVVIQHWLFVVGCWSFPDRSLVKAAHTIQKHAWHLATVLGQDDQLCQALRTIQRCLGAGCRINKSQKSPPTFQLLLDLELAGLA